MMKLLLRSVLLLTLLAVLPINAQAREIFVHGKIRWVSNTPAEGMRVELVKNGKVAASSLTNARGVYVFYDLPGQPGHYVLRVKDRGEILTEQALPDVDRGSRIADIKVR